MIIAEYNKCKPCILIHGGAVVTGLTSYSSEKQVFMENTMRNIVDKSILDLNNGASASDIVVEAVAMMENSKFFNAGLCSALTDVGTVELEAVFMNGKSLRFGACSSIKRLQNPIILSRHLSELGPTPHLAGVHAEERALQLGMQLVDNDFLIDKNNNPFYLEAKKNLNFQQDGSGTVGAVAMDLYGNLAAATSTGGMPGKCEGRISDASAVGQSTYADNDSVAIACTGIGGQIMAISLAKDIAAKIEHSKMTLSKAVNSTLNDKFAKIGGKAGLIAIDKNGNCICACNSVGLNWAIALPNLDTRVEIFSH